MQYVKTDTDTSIYVEFLLDNQLVVPDAGSATATLTEADGTPLSGYDGVSLVPGAVDSFVVVDILAAANARLNDYELRLLTINYSVNSKPVVLNLSYLVVDRVSFPVSPKDVRLLIGVDEDELANESIDIISAYEDLKSEDELDGFDLDTLLVGGTSSVRELVDAIKYKAALNILPTLELIAVQSLQADNVSFRRFEKVDFDKLRHTLNAEYGKKISRIVGDSSTNLTYALVSTGTDAVTGEEG